MILVLVVSSVCGIYVYYSYFTRGHCLVFLTRFNYVSALRLPIMLKIVLMLIAAYCALNYAGIMCACLLLS